MVDTGLDQRSCFFSDRRGNVLPTTYSAAKFDLTRRKVVQVRLKYAKSREAQCLSLDPVETVRVGLGARQFACNKAANFSQCPFSLHLCVSMALQYVVWADQSDVNSGHGTHVAGTS